MDLINSLTQISGFYRPICIDSHQNKKFIFCGKIYYKNKLTDSSFAVLTAFSVSAEKKIIGAPLFNTNASIFHKSNDWSSYKLEGQIAKNAKYLAIGVAIQGNDSYYFDEFKLNVKSKNTIVEIPVKDFEVQNNSFKNWEVQNFNKSTKFQLCDNISTSGKAILVDNSFVKIQSNFGNNQQVGNFIDVNGIKLYYEIYGEGEPLLLLSGNNSSMTHYINQVYILSKSFMVIGLDSRGQGKSSASNAKITYEVMADDVNVFLEEMNLSSINILGWSDGGNIALILALLHPEKVNKMAIVGANLFNNETSVNNETNELIKSQIKEMEANGVEEANMDYRMKKLLLCEPNIDPDSLLNLKIPTYVMAGENDVIKQSHTKLIAEKLPNSELLIFKGVGHEAPKEIPRIFNKKVLKFFKKKLHKDIE